MTLENAFYIIAIVTMSLMLILMISLVAAVIAIKVKINHLHHMLTDKAHAVQTVAESAKNFIKKVRK